MTNIYVGNLLHSSTETELRNLFAVHGTVENVNIISDRETGRPRGFAVVEMANWDEARKAMAALNGSEFGGRTLNINEAKPKSTRPRSNGIQRYGRTPSGRSGGGRDDYRGHARQPREPRW